MGTLRLEPKATLMDAKRYAHLASTLREGRIVSQQNQVFYDLSNHETKPQTKKDLLEVAEKEGIQLQVRGLKGSQSLALLFDQAPTPKPSPRLDPETYHQKVIEVLARSDRPLQKREILAETGMSASSWNLRIKELLRSGRVQRQGLRREAVYFLTS